MSECPCRTYRRCAAHKLVPIDRPPRFCLWCGEPFSIFARTNQLYCSPWHKTAASRNGKVIKLKVYLAACGHKTTNPRSWLCRECYLHPVAALATYFSDLAA